MLLLLAACAAKDHPASDGGSDETGDAGDADTDLDADADADADSDADADPGGDLASGFEATLTTFYACVGQFIAVDGAETVALTFDANDLAAAAFLDGTDTVTTLDLAVEGARMEVWVGSGFSVEGMCSAKPTSVVVDRVYEPVAGSAEVSIWPHQSQQEQTEGALVLDAVELTSAGAPDVTLGHLEFARQVIGGLP